MPGERVEHPLPGWNEVPHQPGSYAWWDGQRFTTIAFRADDHWEYVTDDIPEARAAWTPEPRNRGARTGLIILIAIAASVALGFVVLAMVAGFESNQLHDRVAAVHRALETNGFHCRGLSITDPQFLQRTWAVGSCRLDAAHRATEIRIQADTDQAIAYEADGGPTVIGPGWFLRAYPDDVKLLRDIAAKLGVRCTNCNSAAIDTATAT
jgi:hypothetical protein